MLEGIDEIDWDNLEKAYEPASELPDLLRAVASGDPALTQEAVPGDLAVDWGLIHQGCVYSATAAVVPFLVELAADPAVLVQDQLLSTVAWAAVFEGQTSNRPHGVRRAVATQVPVLVDFLDHVDPLIRVNAATALGHTDPPHAPTGQLLNACRADEPDSRVRAALLVSSVACDPTNGREWVLEAYQDQDAAVQAAAIYAGTLLGLPWTDHATEALHASLIDGDPLPESEYWFWDIRWWLGVALERLDEEARWQVVQELLASTSTPVRAAGVEAADHLLERALLAVASWAPVLRGLTKDPDRDIRKKAKRSTSLQMEVFDGEQSWRWTSTATWSENLSRKTTR